MKLRKSNFDNLRITWFRCVFFTTVHCTFFRDDTRHISQCFGDREIWEHCNVKKLNRRLWKNVYRTRKWRKVTWGGGES